MRFSAVWQSSIPACPSIAVSFAAYCRAGGEGVDKAAQSLSSRRMNSCQLSRTPGRSAATTSARFALSKASNHSLHSTRSKPPAFDRAVGAVLVLVGVLAEDQPQHLLHAGFRRDVDDGRRAGAGGGPVANGVVVGEGDGLGQGVSPGFSDGSVRDYHDGRCCFKRRREGMVAGECFHLPLVGRSEVGQTCSRGWGSCASSGARPPTKGELLDRRRPEPHKGEVKRRRA